MLQPPKPGPPPAIHLHTAVRALFSKGIWSLQPPAQHPSVAPQCSEAKLWLLQHFRGGAEWSVPMLTHPCNLIMSPGLWVSHSFPLNDFFFRFSNFLCVSFTVSSLLVFSLLLLPSSPLLTRIYCPPSQEKIFPIPTAVNQDPSRYSRDASRCYNPCPVWPRLMGQGKLWQQRPQLAWPQCLTLTRCSGVLKNMLESQVHMLQCVNVIVNLCVNLTNPQFPNSHSNTSLNIAVKVYFRWGLHISQ